LPFFLLQHLFVMSCRGLALKTQDLVMHISPPLRTLSTQDVPLLSLLKSCGQELALRTKYPWRRYAWLVNDDVADSGVKYTVLQVSEGMPSLLFYVHTKSLVSVLANI